MRPGQQSPRKPCCCSFPCCARQASMRPGQQSPRKLAAPGGLGVVTIPASMRPGQQSPRKRATRRRRGRASLASMRPGQQSPRKHATRRPPSGIARRFNEAGATIAPETPSGRWPEAGLPLSGFNEAGATIAPETMSIWGLSRRLTSFNEAGATIAPETDDGHVPGASAAPASMRPGQQSPRKRACFSSRCEGHTGASMRPGQQSPRKHVWLTGGTSYAPLRLQ